MTAQPDVKKLVRQTQRYEFSDGLRDLQLALLMVATGLVYWVVFDQANVWLVWMLDAASRIGGGGRWSVLIIALVPGLLALAAALVMRFVRSRWLWRERGYVNPSKRLIPVWVNLGAFSVVLAALALGAALQQSRPADDLFFLRILLIASGWGLGFVLVAMGWRLKLPRYVIVGLGASVLTAVLLVLPLTVGQIGLVWGLIWGVALASSSFGPLREAVRATGKTHHE